MKKMMLMAAVAAVCGMTSAEGSAVGPGRVMRPDGGGFGGQNRDPIIRMVSNPKVAEKIGLSGEQQAKVAELAKRQPGDGRENQKKLRAARERQAELLKAEQIDEAAVMAAIDEVYEISKTIEKEQVKKTIAVRALLTPEQFRQLDSCSQEIREMRRAEMRERFSRRSDGKGSRRDGRETRGTRQDEPQHDADRKSE